MSKIFLPGKRNKVEARVGFTSFGEVKNLDKLISQLNSIWFGSFKLRSHPALFSKSNHREPLRKVAKHAPLDLTYGTYVGKVSFKEVMVRGSCVTGEKLVVGEPKACKRLIS